MSKETGEVGFDAGGKRYTLVYSVNALCEMEAAIGISVAAIGEALGKVDGGSARFVRSLFWAGLTDHHGDLTIKDAGRLMQEIGGIAKATALFTEAFALAFPDDARRASGPEVDTLPLDSARLPEASARDAPTGDQSSGSGAR